jgi:formylglycine-generating enzyme required for sulfatase activity
VFSCRTLDYGSKLTTKELPRISQVEVTPLNDEQVESFLSLYSLKHGTALWGELRNSPQFDLYRSPFYLKLLIEQANDGHIPEGRASLFTGYVRVMLKRELDGDNPRFKEPTLLPPRDRERFGQWKTPYELPGRGKLFKALAAFAFNMQAQRASGDKSQVRVGYDDALNSLTDITDDDTLKDSLLKAAADLQILDLPGDDVLFVHQLLQEYFAARYLAERIDAAKTADELTALCRIAEVKWLEADISPSVGEKLQSLSKSGTLPDLPTTGWEETFLLATEMVSNSGEFLRTLAEYNLPLAGRCAAQPDVTLSDDLRAHLQQALVSRSRDPATDLRARIQAGLALGYLGDPRFERRQGPFGPFLFPPMVAIDGGTYSIGSDEGLEEDEAPQHEVSLAPFSLGQFPVTNAEYRCFIEAGGYQDERWWEMPAARRWRKGEGTGEGIKANWCDWRNKFRRKKDLLERIAGEQAWSDETFKSWRDYCSMDDAAFEAMLKQRFPDQQFTYPKYWKDSAFNVPSQPVVGVCWFEAQAYCAWLSSQTSQPFRLPTEAEWEAAARGQEGRRYPWGEMFDPTCCNALESKLRRTTPIGVFPSGDTPISAISSSLAAQLDIQGLADMSGNVWEWVSSRYSPYPYQAGSGREDVAAEGRRVLRGGSWIDNGRDVHSADRYGDALDNRNYDVGFRLVLGK